MLRSQCSGILADFAEFLLASLLLNEVRELSLLARPYCTGIKSDRAVPLIGLNHRASINAVLRPDEGVLPNLRPLQFALTRFY